MPAHLPVGIAVAAELATAIGIVPVVGLGFLAWRGEARGAAWWWLAGAFAVSWVADNLARFMDPWGPSVAYPLSQAALIGAVLLERREALQLVGMLVVVAIIAVVAKPEGPDLVLRTVAWGSAAWIAWRRKPLGHLRTALVIAFAGGWVAWVGVVLWQGWTSWIVYQSVRATAAGMFCYAAMNPGPQLKVLRMT